MSKKTLDHVNYDSLDRAKNAFIEASKKTANFAANYGFIQGKVFGSSANVFELDLKPFLKKKSKKLHITLLPEGLGTADDARPGNLSEKESYKFWYNIGIKTVGVTTNDAASSGMQTILISLYLPSASPEIVFNKNFMSGFLDGFVSGCKEVGCVYFSGETPQLKNKIYPDKLDIAGALFGLTPPGTEPIDGSKLSAGNYMVFIPSTGPDANGFTSLRQLAIELPDGYRTRLPNGQEYWEAINNPTLLLTPLIQAILKAGINPSNVEPITGHGWQKIMRSSKPLRYVVEEMLPVPEIFKFIQKQKNTTTEEMIKIFNYGLGFVIYTENKKDAQKIVKVLKSKKIKAIIGGYVEKADQREVLIKPLKITLNSQSFRLKQ